jgi:hypothetical protein
MKDSERGAWCGARQQGSISKQNHTDIRFGSPLRHAAGARAAALAHVGRWLTSRGAQNAALAKEIKYVGFDASFSNFFPFSCRSRRRRGCYGVPGRAAQLVGSLSPRQRVAVGRSNGVLRQRIVRA